MYIKITQSIFSSKYGMLDIGRVVEVTEKEGKEFIKAGFAVENKPEPKEEPKKPARKTATKKETPKQEAGEE